MLVKKFVPRALLQQNQKPATLLSNLFEVAVSLGYLLLNPSFNNTVANISTERNLWHNFFFYHRKKMKLKEKVIASRLTVAVQEALVRGEVFDVRGIGDKIAYSYAFNTSYTWIDIPDVKASYHCDDKVFNRSSCVMIRPSSSQLTKMQGHSYYLAEINQCLSSENFKVLNPTLKENGWIYYQLLPLGYDPRFNFSSWEKMTTELSQQRGKLPLTKDLTLNKLSHMIITAKTGYGKTQLALAISAELGCLDKTILYFLDPKHSDLSSFGQFLGADRYADSTEEIDTKIHELVELMQSRYKMMRQLADKNPEKYVGKSAEDFGFKSIVVVFDEVSAHLSASKKCLADLRQLMMLGRQAGVYLMLIMQDPRATNNLPSTIKDQTEIKIALGEFSGTLASLVFGSGVVLPAGSRGVGEGYIQVNGDEPELFESPLMPPNSYNLYNLMKQALESQQFLDPMERT